MSPKERIRNPTGRLVKAVAGWKLSRRVRTLLADLRTPNHDRVGRALDRGPTIFSYRKPPEREKGKEVVRLCETPILRGGVQIVRKTTPENLLSHEGVDGFWFVVRGRVRFYESGNVTLGELGPREGILIPSTTQYGFESASAEDLELLQVLGYDPSGRIKRKDHAPKMYDRADVRFFDARPPSRDGAEIAAADGSFGSPARG